MATEKETQKYATNLALYEKLIATNPAVERHFFEWSYVFFTCQRWIIRTQAFKRG
jgi:hypothetical protein